MKSRKRSEIRFIAKLNHSSTKVGGVSGANMKVTGLSPQVRDANRVNVYIDGSYNFSLDLAQVIDLSVKVGNEYTESELESLKDESIFGKLYNRSLEYSLVRPRSVKELRDYLYKKTLDKRRPDGSLAPGVSKSVTDRVLDRLVERSYVDDYKFATYWVENRKLRKGISAKMLRSELLSKGVESSIIDTALEEDDTRNDIDELAKVIARKSRLYSDESKFKAYLMRQGYRYDDIVNALDSSSPSP